MMDGRVKTAASEGAWRSSCHSRQQRPRRGRARARNSPHRSARRKSLSVRSDSCEGRILRRLRREHRCRRSSDDSWRREDHESVTVVVEPADYERVLEEITANDGATTLALRKALAAKAIRAHRRLRCGHQQLVCTRDRVRSAPKWRAFGGHLAQALRYGENAHQTAALYLSADNRTGVATARQLQGKELSYNNINDTDAAFELVSEFASDVPAVAIIKHANPCGVAEGSLAFRCVSKSARVRSRQCVRRHHRTQPDDRRGHGGRRIAKIFTEVVIAPDATDEAKAIFAGKKNLRLLLTGGLANSRCVGSQFQIRHRRLPRPVAR